MILKKLCLLMILSLMLFTSCSNDDDSNQTDTLNGIWNLKNVRGGFIGVDIDFNQGEVKWDFNLENNTLIVENNIMTTGPEDIYTGLDSGIYEIRIEENEDIESIFIDDVERGIIILLDDNLKIDDSFFTSDGFITEFER